MRMQRHNERGFVILMVSMSVLAGILTFTTTGLGRSMIELLAAQRSVAVTQAFHIAEGGVDEAIATFATAGHEFLVDAGWVRQATDDEPCVAGTPCVKTLSTAVGTVTVSVSDIGAERPLVTAEGAVGTTTMQRIEAVLELPPPLFQQPLFAADAIQLEDVVVDSYNASLGGYGELIMPSDDEYGSLNKSDPSRASSLHGDLRTNGTERWDVDLTDTTIFGSVMLGAGELEEEAYCEHGAVLVHGAPPQSQAASNLGLSPITVPDGLCAGQQLNGSATLAAGTYCYEAVSLKGSSKVVRTNGPVTIYVTDTLKVEDGAQLVGAVGGVETPSALRIEYLGEQAELKKNVRFVGTLYAPAAKMKVEENTELFGAVMVDELEGKQSTIHYDRALSDPDAGQPASRPTIRSWHQP